MSECFLGQERLRKFLCRAAAGEELTVGFFGGSITQGSLASKEEFCYAYRVYELLAERFPRAAFRYVNAGIGGTGSHFGAMRIDDDLLRYRPDLVIVDFSVNDMEAVLPLYAAGETEASSGAAWGEDTAAEKGQAASEGGEQEVKIYPETFEAVLRRALASETAPAVIVLNNVFYDTGASVEEEHNRIAGHYGVPHVSVRDTILPRIRAGEFAREEISPDGLHPNDRGHALIAREILKLIDGVVLEMAEGEAIGGAPCAETETEAAWEPLSADEESERELLRMDGADTLALRRAELPAPITANAYEHAARLHAGNCAPDLRGFAADAGREKERWDFFRDGWIGRSIGDRIALDVTGGSLAVMYRKTVRRPSPVARLVLDGDEARAVTLDGNFDQDWGDCLFLQPILHHGAPGKHHVEVEIVRAGAEDKSPFYLLSFQSIAGK